MELFQPITTTRTADEVVDQIERLVLSGILRPGDRLPGERDLAQQIAVSRPVLREALATLEERGITVARHGGGTFIADLVGEVFSPAMMRLIATHREAVRDYLDYRHEVEGIAAEMAARRATAEDRSQIRDTLDAMARASELDDPELEADIDVSFHTLIAESAHNMILLHTMRSCYRLLADGVFFNRAMVYAFPNARQKLLAQHMAIGEAVIDGKPDAAKEAAQAHILFVGRSMEEAERSGDYERVSKLRRVRSYQTRTRD